MTRTLAGKVALVTGGSRGIGAAIVRRLATDGASVALTYGKDAEGAARVVRDVETAGGRAIAIEADSANAGAIQRAVAAAIDAFGPIDILVNNAGILLGGMVESFPLDDFDRMIAVNVRAAFIAIQAVVPQMKAGGRIINIGSNTAHRNSVAGSSVYTLTKSAISGLTRGLAHELGPKSITVNSIDPGPTRTVMSRGVTDPGPLGDKLRSMIAVGRVGEPEEVAAMVSYVAGPESGYVTGARLVIDGGMST
jgi:3-oxoacyl-[acyl-carrier protein] reductase